MVIADRVVLMNEGRIDQIGAPVEIYQRPTSRFGAEFIGLANIIEATVVANGATTRVRLPGGIELDSATRDGHPPNAKVDVMCRPEDLRVSAERSRGAERLPAKVQSTFFLGNIADVYVSAGPLTFRGQLSPPELWPEGKDVWVQDPAAKRSCCCRRNAQEKAAMSYLPQGTPVRSHRPTISPTGISARSAICAFSAATRAAASVIRRCRSARTAARSGSNGPGAGHRLGVLLHDRASPDPSRAQERRAVQHRVVHLDEADDVRLVSNVIDVAPEEIAVGLRVTLAWDEIEGGMFLPRFRKA